MSPALRNASPRASSAEISLVERLGLAEGRATRGTSKAGGSSASSDGEGVDSGGGAAAAPDVVSASWVSHVGVAVAATASADPSTDNSSAVKYRCAVLAAATSTGSAVGCRLKTPIVAAAIAITLVPKANPTMMPRRNARV